MPSILSRKDSSFASRTSNHSISSAIFDRFRGFGTSSRDKAALNCANVRPLTYRNVETHVEDQRVDEAMSRCDRSMKVKIAFWLKDLEYEISEDGLKSTQLSMQNSPSIEGVNESDDLPEGGSYSESIMADR